MEKHISNQGLTDQFKPPATKVCRSCKSEKPIKEFAQNPRGKFGYANDCKACDKEVYEMKKAAHAEYAKNYFTF